MDQPTVFRRILVRANVGRFEMTAPPVLILWLVIWVVQDDARGRASEHKGGEVKRGVIYLSTLWGALQRSVGC